MAKMNKPGEATGQVRVVELHEDVANDAEIESLSVTDFATRDGDDDKDSPPAPVKTVDEDDIPEAGKVWFKVLADGKLERWKQTPSD